MRWLLSLLLAFLKPFVRRWEQYEINQANKQHQQDDQQHTVQQNTTDSNAADQDESDLNNQRGQL